eukprot:CCRYP_000430-RA/>CCRYP_000430-RA protein AED:0.32 eAED:0.32 QI:40/1/1/1/0/0/2/216/84
MERNYAEKSRRTHFSSVQRLTCARKSSIIFWFLSRVWYYFFIANPHRVDLYYGMLPYYQTIPYLFSAISFLYAVTIDKGLAHIM